MRAKTSTCSIVFFLALFFFSLPIESPAQASKTYGLAVMNVKAIGIPETAAASLTETFHTSFSELIARRPPELKDAYELLERSQMDKIFDQFQTQDTGCTDVQCAVEFGKMLSVQRIVISSVGQVEETYTVTVRLVDVESSKVIRSVSRKHAGKLSGVIDLLPFMGYEVLTGVKPVYPVVKQQGEIISSPVSKVLPNIKEMPAGLTMVNIPAGTFQMGSMDGNSDEKPIHTVSISAFEMSATEITQGQYKTVMGKNPSKFTGYDNLPVENVTWLDAVRFCNALSEIASLEKCYNERTWECYFLQNGFRFPTEAEWEYACRAGTTTKYYTGDTDSDLERAGWYSENSNSTTHPVGQKTPNLWGLYDMHGNVWELCNDWYGRYTTEYQTNQTGIRKDGNRVVRGGSFKNKSFHCRSASRYYRVYSSSRIGFRVVRHVSP